MEVRLMAYLKGNTIRELKENAKETTEYRDINSKMMDAKSRYDEIAERYEKQAMGLKASEKNPIAFQMKLSELKKKALKELNPIQEEVKIFEKKLREISSIMLTQQLPIEAEAEVDKIFNILKELKVENVSRDKLFHLGKLGSACILNLHFDADKNKFKEIKKHFNNASLDKIEVLIEG